MFKKGFIVLHRRQGIPGLMACPVLATGPDEAREQFVREKAQGGSPDIVEVLSLEDLDRHRRSLLALAQEAGVDLEMGPSRAD